jgi:hypothetical protein
LLELKVIGTNLQDPDLFIETGCCRIFGKNPYKIGIQNKILGKKIRILSGSDHPLILHPVQSHTNSAKNGTVPFRHLTLRCLVKSILTWVNGQETKVRAWGNYPITCLPTEAAVWLHYCNSQQLNVCLLVATHNNIFWTVKIFLNDNVKLTTIPVFLIISKILLRKICTLVISFFFLFKLDDVQCGTNSLTKMYRLSCSTGVNWFYQNPDWNKLTSKINDFLLNILFLFYPSIFGHFSQCCYTSERRVFEHAKLNFLAFLDSCLIYMSTRGYSISKVVTRSRLLQSRTYNSKWGPQVEDFSCDFEIPFSIIPQIFFLPPFSQ